MHPRKKDGMLPHEGTGLSQAQLDVGSPASQVQVGIKAEAGASGGAFAEVILETIDSRMKGTRDS